MKRIPLVLAAGIAAAALLAACGGQDVSTGKVPGKAGGTPVAGAEAIAVQAKNYAFSPDHLTVRKGQEVALQLVSEDSGHDFAVDGLGRVADVGGGEHDTERLRIDKPGRYTFFCTIPGHRDAGMEGTIVVK
jgi:plastocyanin